MFLINTYEDMLINKGCYEEHIEGNMGESMITVYYCNSNVDCKMIYGYYNSWKQLFPGRIQEHYVERSFFTSQKFALLLFFWEVINNKHLVGHRDAA